MAVRPLVHNSQAPRVTHHPAYTASIGVHMGLRRWLLGHDLLMGVLWKGVCKEMSYRMWFHVWTIGTIVPRSYSWYITVSISHRQVRMALRLLQLSLPISRHSGSSGLKIALREGTNVSLSILFKLKMCQPWPDKRVPALGCVHTKYCSWSFYRDEIPGDNCVYHSWQLLYLKAVFWCGWKGFFSFGLRYCLVFFMMLPSFSFEISFTVETWLIGIMKILKGAHKSACTKNALF